MAGGGAVSPAQGGEGRSEVTVRGGGAVLRGMSTPPQGSVEAVQGEVGGHLWAELRQPEQPQRSWGWGLQPLSPASCLQAEKCEDSVPPNHGELTVRAKLVLPAGPRKLQEAQEGRWPPAP